MLLFLKGIIIGVGKIIPGVSGALLAINFNLYEKILDSLTNFFSNWKYNIKFLSILFSGIILSIVFGSKILIYLLNNYKFLTFIFFLGLISGGTYIYSKKYISKKNIFPILLVVLLISYLFLNIKSPNNYLLKNNYLDNIIYFIGGYIEVLTSIIPGISGTAIELILGIYENILSLISNISNISYIYNNINLYISFSLGLFISFIINIFLVSYLLKRYPYQSSIFIIILSISSIILLISIIFSIKYTITDLFISIPLFFLGIILSILFSK